VRSVLPPSTSTISSAISRTDFNARGRFSSSFCATMQTLRRFISAGRYHARASISHTAKPLLRLKMDPDRTAAHAEFSPILQHRRAHPLFLEESSVRRIEVFQIHEVIADFQQTVVP